MKIPKKPLKIHNIITISRKITDIQQITYYYSNYNNEVKNTDSDNPIQIHTKLILNLNLLTFESIFERQ